MPLLKQNTKAPWNQNHIIFILAHGFSFLLVALKSYFLSPFCTEVFYSKQTNHIFKHVKQFNNVKFEPNIQNTQKMKIRTWLEETVGNNY